MIKGGKHVCFYFMLKCVGGKNVRFMELEFLTSKNKKFNTGKRPLDMDRNNRRVCMVLSATSEQAILMPGLQARIRASLRRSSVGIDLTSIGFVNAV